MAARRRTLIAAIGAVVLATTVNAGPSGIGIRPTDAQIAAWNIDVAPDGKSLPAGRGSVADGHVLYDQQCAACHGRDLEGGMGPPLAGGVGTLASDKPFKTVGSYWPYATTLFDYIRRTMPLAAPQSLTDDQVYALTGYVLFRNGILEETAIVDAAEVLTVKMPNREGFFVDDRPDTDSVACYRNCLNTEQAGRRRRP